MNTDVIQTDKKVVDEGRSTIEQAVLSDYKYGFVTEIEADEAPRGLTEDTIRFISAKKNEPQWMLDWRLKAYRQWLPATGYEGSSGDGATARGHHGHCDFRSHQAP